MASKKYVTSLFFYLFFYLIPRRSFSDHYLRSCGYVTCSRPQRTATGGLEPGTSRPIVLGFTTAPVRSSLWQKRWDKLETGRTYHSYFPKVDATRLLITLIEQPSAKHSSSKQATHSLMSTGTSLGRQRQTKVNVDRSKQLSTIRKSVLFRSKTKWS